MAKVKTTKTQRRKYYRRYKKIKAVDTYFNCKLEWNGLIRWPLVDGGPVMLATGTTEGATARTFNQLLRAGSTDQVSNSYVLLNRLFSYMRIRGVAIEVTPSIRNAGASSAVVNPQGETAGLILTNDYPVYIGVLWGTTQTVTDTELRTANTSFQLNPLQKVRKYFSNYGGSDDYKTTTGELGYPGVVQLLGSNGTSGNSPMWSMKITFYCRYKIQKTI